MLPCSKSDQQKKGEEITNLAEKKAINTLAKKESDQ